MNSKVFLKLSFSVVFLCTILETRPKCGRFRTCDTGTELGLEVRGGGPAASYVRQLQPLTLLLYH